MKTARTVLIVDDDEANLALLGHMLRGIEDVDVICESESVKALDLVENRLFDVVVADIIMPPPDGLALLASCKRLHPETQVVMLSGEPTLDRVIEALKHDAFDFISKPVEKEKFRTTVRNALERSKLIRENKRMAVELRQMNEELELRIDEATAELQEKIHELDVMSRNYRAILDNMPSGCLVLDEKGRIFQINHAASTVLGFDSPDQALGNPLPATQNLAPLTDLLDALEPDGSCRRQLRLGRSGSGTSDAIVLNLSACRLSSAFGDQFTVAVIEDVSEIKALEDSLRRSRTLATVGGLAAGIAHEIKNPLGAIRGLGELLSMKIEAVTQLKRFSDNIMSEVDRLTRIINDISSFSRDVRPERQDVDFRKLLEETAAFHRDKIGGRNLELEITGEMPDIPYDYTQFKHALDNIIDNAVAATGEDGVIRIRAWADNESLTVSISDDGCGMTEEETALVFKPFYSTNRTKGSGLGLTITEKIVKDHGGTITVSSRKGQGSEFTITLPMNRADESERAAGPAAPR